MINSRSHTYHVAAKIMGLALLFFLNSNVLSFKPPASSFDAMLENLRASGRPGTASPPIAITPIASTPGSGFSLRPSTATPYTPSRTIFGAPTTPPPLPTSFGAPALGSPFGGSTLPRTDHSPFTSTPSLGGLGLGSTAKEDLTRESAAYKKKIAQQTKSLRSKILTARAETFKKYMIQMQPRIAALKPLEATDRQAAQLIQALQSYPTVVANLHYLQLMNQLVQKLEASRNIYLLDMATELKQGVNLAQQIQNLQKEKTQLENKIKKNQPKYVTQKTIAPFTKTASNVAAFRKSEEAKFDKQLEQLRTTLIKQFPLVDRALAQLKADSQELIDLKLDVESKQEEVEHIAKQNQSYRQAFRDPAELEKYLKENQNSPIKQVFDEEQSLRYQFDQANAQYQAALAKAADHQGAFKAIWEFVMRNKALTTIIVGGLIFAVVMLALSGDDKSSSKGVADLDELKKRLTALDISPSLYTDAQLDIVLQQISALGYTISTISDANLKSLLTSLGSASSNTKSPVPTNTYGTPPFTSPGLSNPSGYPSTSGLGSYGR